MYNYIKDITKEILLWLKQSNLLYSIRRILFFLWIVFTVFIVVKYIVFPSKQVNGDTAKLQKVTVYVDKSGMHSEIRSTELTKEQMQNITNSIANSLKGRVEIKEVTKYVVHTDTIFKKIPVTTDTATGDFTLSKTDNYIDIAAYGNYKTDTGYLKYKSIDTLTYVDYTKKHLLKANERIINLTNKNPYNLITEGSSISLKESRPLVSLGLQAGYNPFSQKPYLGIGIQFNVLTLYSK